MLAGQDEAPVVKNKPQVQEMRKNYLALLPFVRRRREAKSTSRSAVVTALLTVTLSAVQLSAQTVMPPVDPADTKALAAISKTKTTPNGQTQRAITISDAVTIFLQQNLQLVAAKYDISTAEAEKLSARVRPNPEITVGSAGLPIFFRGPLIASQTFSYNISQDLELGGKRAKRIDLADADTQVAQAQFEIAVWQMTNDVKRKFYAVLLAKALLDLSNENQKTFEEIVQRTTDIFRSGEISGLDLQRLEVEKFKFDTDVANSERDYQLALRDLRLALGGDYMSMNIETAGAMDYYKSYDFSFADLRDKALSARPDLKAAQIEEKAADANIRLQDAQKIPNLTLTGGVNQVPAGGSNYNYGVGIVFPSSDRNQTARSQALIAKQKSANLQQQLTNQVISDVDKAVVGFNIQKRRLELYKTGVLSKVNDIQTSTEYALKVGESSTLELLDAIRTRRDTLAAFYQTIFDYQMSLLDVELATATPLQ
jgi:cobalt-zinc-cadmium efflux system outer membrane protein